VVRAKNSVVKRKKQGQIYKGHFLFSTGFVLLPVFILAGIYFVPKQTPMSFAKRAIFLLLLLVASAGSFAQNRDSLLRLYNNETIRRHGSNFQKGGNRLLLVI
jgi:hypothetical protein